MSLSRQQYVAANREGWNESAPRHAARNLDRLLSQFSVPGHSCLDEVETARLKALGVTGRDVAQLCCNNGQELVSVKNLGAARCVGFDNADAFLDQARALSRAAGVSVEFHQGDIHDIPARYDANFDILYVTVGVLCWMPRLVDFFTVADRLLRPGGAILVYEHHPILTMWDPFDDVDPPLWKHSYFKQDPWVDTDGLDYFTGGTYDSKPLYTFQHTLSDILMACIDNRLAIEHFAEFPHDPSPCYGHLERLEAKLPLSYILVARKSLDLTS